MTGEQSFCSQLLNCLFSKTIFWLKETNFNLLAVQHSPTATKECSFLTNLSQHCNIAKSASFDYLLSDSFCFRRPEMMTLGFS